MRFEAENYKDYFRKLKNYILVMVIVGVISCVWLMAYIADTTGTMGPSKDLGLFITIIILLGVALVIGSVVFFHFIDKEISAAEQYGLVIEESVLRILCKRESIEVPLLNVDGFDVCPKQQGAFRIKLDAAYIEIDGKLYEMLYLKDLSSAKRIFEVNKKKLIG